MKNIIFTILIGLFLTTAVLAATEDFAEYTFEDPSSKLTTTTSRLTFTALDRGPSTYAYRDMGAYYFGGDFEHTLEFYISDFTSSGYGAVWMLSNVIDDIGVQEVAGSFLSLTPRPSQPNLDLREQDSGDAYTDSFVMNATGTNYYPTMIRDEATGTYGVLYAYIYDDEPRTNLVDTLVIVLHSSKKDYQYIYAINNASDAGTGFDITGYMENLDITTTTVGSAPASDEETIIMKVIR